MKTLATVFTFLLVSFSSFSQDVIMKRDGSKIDAKVVEITANTIKYRNFDQPEGPIRNILINDVQEIIYDDGSWEKFEKVERVEPTESNPKSPAQYTRKEPEPKDFIFGNGFFLEAIIGVNNYSENDSDVYFYDDEGNYFPYGFETLYTERSTLTSIGLRLGNKWYFGKREKWRPGLQATYVKLGLYVNPDSHIEFTNSLSVGNVGFANAFKLSESQGIEVNANVGLTIMNMFPPYFTDPAAGINYGIEVKYRYKVLAVGLDFSRMEANIGNEWRKKEMNIFSVSIGAKF